MTKLGFGSAMTAQKRNHKSKSSALSSLTKKVKCNKYILRANRFMIPATLEAEKFKNELINAYAENSKITKGKLKRES